jgi:hypothetical protein
MTQGNKASEQLRLIRWRMSHETSTFAQELQIIPRWLKVLMIVLSVIAQIVAQIVYTYVPQSEHFPRIALAGAVAGGSIGFAALLFLFVYVNRDAKRRQMNATVWTLAALFVPYLIGLIIYFLVREPLPFPCPQCGATVSARFNFCPSCKFNLRPTCPQCKHEVRLEDRYCPHCACELAPKASLASPDATPGVS